MSKKIRFLNIVLFLFLLLTSVLYPVIAESPAAVTVTDSTATMDFPLALNFSAMVNSNLNIIDIRLKYKIDQMSFADVTDEAVAVFKPGSAIKATYALDLRKVGGLPPGAKLKYWWLIRDDAGIVLESSPLDFQISDNRYKWQSLKEGNINLFWYQGDNNFSETLMSSAQGAIKQLQQSTGATPSEDIYIYIYKDANDLQGSMIYPNEWTGGVSFSNFNIIAIGINQTTLGWGQGAMIHELTHNIINQVVFNPYSDLPVWLNEGLAMYNQGPLTQQFSIPLDTAVMNNALFSVRSLCSPFSAYANVANLSYAESYSLVNYLISQYGSEKMLSLLHTFKNGNTYDDAFQSVYGFDIEGLDANWKSWLTNPERRVSYDLRYQKFWEAKWDLQSDASGSRSYVDDSEAREGLLSLYYVQRRSSMNDPGLGELEVGRLMRIPIHLIEFHIWYLKEKGWIQRLENGKFALTALGVDEVEKGRLRLHSDRLIPAHTSTGKEAEWEADRKPPESIPAQSECYY